MQYRVTSDFIAFGRNPLAGEVIELTTEQAESLAENRCIAPYEVKVELPPKVQGVKKSARSSQQGRASQSRTRKRRIKQAK